MLMLGYAGCQVRGSLYYLGNFSVNQKSFPNKSLFSKKKGGGGGMV